MCFAGRAGRGLARRSGEQLDQALGPAFQVTRRGGRRRARTPHLHRGSSPPGPLEVRSATLRVCHQRHRSQPSHSGRPPRHGSPGASSRRSRATSRRRGAPSSRITTRSTVGQRVTPNGFGRPCGTLRASSANVAHVGSCRATSGGAPVSSQTRSSTSRRTSCGEAMTRLR